MSEFTHQAVVNFGPEIVEAFMDNKRVLWSGHPLGIVDSMVKNEGKTLKFRIANVDRPGVFRCEDEYLYSVEWLKDLREIGEDKPRSIEKTEYPIEEGYSITRPTSSDNDSFYKKINVIREINYSIPNLKGKGRTEVQKILVEKIKEIATL